MDCSQGTICFELAKGLPAAITTIGIGIPAVLITRQQDRLARAKLKLDLFEQRMEVFQKVWAFMSEMAMKGPTDPFHDVTNVFPVSGFLFGPEIEEYLRDAGKKHTELWSFSQKMRQLYSQPTQLEIDRNAEPTNWFFEEASFRLKERFAPYLDFE